VVILFLKDRIPPFPTAEALKFFESQFGLPASKVFAEISEKPVAAASLGQVYRGIIARVKYLSVVSAFGRFTRSAFKGYGAHLTKLGALEFIKLLLLHS